MSDEALDTGNADGADAAAVAAAAATAAAEAAKDGADKLLSRSEEHTSELQIGRAHV